MAFLRNLRRNVLACFRALRSSAKPSARAPRSSANPSARACVVSSAPALQTHPFDILDFHLGRKLGSGSFGAVFEGNVSDSARITHPKLKNVTCVALKRLCVHREDIQEAEREFKIQEKLSGLPHIAAVYGSFKHQGVLHIAMELLRGRDLRKFLRYTGPLNEGSALRLFRQVLKAVQGMHKRGVAHLDIKPENIMLSTPSSSAGDAELKVIDFGLAHCARAGSSVYDKVFRGVRGTPLYAPPETTSRAAIAPGKFDIWSCGVLLFELLTNKVPFTGSSFGEVSRCARRNIRKLPFPSHISPSCAALLRACLSESPDFRLCATDLLRMVDKILSNQPIHSQVRPSAHDLD